MRIIAAYLLAVLGGNSSPTTDDIKNILDSVGISTDNARADQLVAELKGKDVWQVIEAGKSKLGSVPAVSVAAPGTSTGPSPSQHTCCNYPNEKGKDDDDDDDIFGADGENDGAMGDIFGGDDDDDDDGY